MTSIGNIRTSSRSPVSAASGSPHTLFGARNWWPYSASTSGTENEERKVGQVSHLPFCFPAFRKTRLRLTEASLSVLVNMLSSFLFNSNSTFGIHAPLGATTEKFLHVSESSRAAQRPEAGESHGLVLKTRDKLQQVQYSEHFQHMTARMQQFQVATQGRGGKRAF
jgi:hypothetical protein